MMEMGFAFLLVVIAGVTNGSFALPTKHLKNWRFENIWLNYSLWAFLILPWVGAAVLSPSIFSVYAAAPTSSVLIMLGGGLAFGLGQVCFALALDYIGLGLGFILNIGLGTGLGFLLPLVVLHPEQVLTPFGLTTLFGTLLILLGLFISFLAGYLRDRSKPHSQRKPGHYRLGVWLAVIAGVCSAGQNFTFAMTQPIAHTALQQGVGTLGVSIIMWPGFCFAALIVYAAYMLYLHKKNRSFVSYTKPGFLKYSVFALIMGLFWYGSLVLYSKTAQLIGDLGPVLAWPLFMVLIILTSNFWGWRHKEWAHCSARIKGLAGVGVLALMAAMLVLAFSMTLLHR
jgi:L-rhamnose-H+ transport protein